MDYYEISQSIAETMAKAGAPLTEDQRILLAGAISPWLDKARECCPNGLKAHVDMERQAHESQEG